MYEEIMQNHGLAGVRQLFEPVGGGPYPYVKTRDVGPLRFGDIVVNSDEDVVIANVPEALNQNIGYFSDDMLTSGDEGIGFAQARRLKQKLRRNRRRITPQGYVFQAVEGDAPYQFGDLGKLRISFKNPFGKKSLFGKAKKLVKKIKPLKLASYAAGGIIGGKLLQKGFTAAKGLLNRGPSASEPVEVMTSSPAGVPAPAPTGATDATGAPLPTSIAQAMTSAVSPIPGGTAPTASEEVAAATQDAETANTMEAGVAGPFTMPNFSDPKVLLTLGALGFLVVSQMGKKGGSRRRSRRR